MNKMVYLLIVVIALGALYYVFPGSDPETEALTLEDGIKLAREQGKLIFLYINAKTCPYCRQLEKEFAESEEFQQVVKQDYIWVTLDFQKNYTLARRFGLQGPPAMIILDQDGKAITGIPGYPPRGVLDVIDMLKEVAQ